MKKTVHIISHTHWDREWYLPYEAHHLRLVQLMDDVLQLFDTDPEFKYFHLDGQTIILDDYLEVRPHQREKIQRYITEGKLRIGPFYILQDAFLISGEANVRNALIGRQESLKWGVKGEAVGYYPDTFGLLGQTPQLTKGMEMEVAVYGRGVKPTGFNNQVGESLSYQSVYSEMNWQSPDNSTILGILFANWYSNGNEIPTTESEARAFWQKKLSDAEQYAASNQLIMMNGCDHQPVQKDLSQAIRLANELFPEYEFIHSNFELYNQSLPKDIANQLTSIQGELRSQETDGWYTLANTASARIYLKQRSHDLSLYLEKVIEPLAVIASHNGYPYPHDQIDFAWKKLLQNYPHDSICGCSVDEVHRGMMARFDAVEQLCQSLEKTLLEYLGQFSTSDAPCAFHVWNTTENEASRQVKVRVELARCLFKEARPEECYARMAKLPFESWQVVDDAGNVQVAEVVDAGVHFGYDLPEDAFRVPYMARYADVTLFVQQLAPFERREFYLVPGNSTTSECILQQNTLENNHIKVTLQPSGAVTITDKHSGHIYENQCILEETGDIGNEYIFCEASNAPRRYNLDCVVATRHFECAGEQILVVTYEWALPKSGDEQLTREQVQVIDVTQRKASRHAELVTERVEVTFRLNSHDTGVSVTIEGDNRVLDHRMRVLFQVEGHNSTHVADSAFEYVERSNHVSPQWKNPTNPQTLQHSVAIYQGDKHNGLTITTQGLNEYEVFETATHTVVGITFLRCVGELGDWGYFATPEAQCLGRYSANLYVQPWSKTDGWLDTFKKGATHFVELRTFSGAIGAKQTALALPQLWQYSLPNHLLISAWKQHHQQADSVVRLVNVSNESVNLSDYLAPEYELIPLNLLENPQKYPEPMNVPAYAIQTYQVKRRAL
ncbi:MAG: alpha-mannosidase [Aerococcaceae bacterium]|nr:alpha-mannosidase [Aerococcaceae bacterium]